MPRVSDRLLDYERRTSVPLLVLGVVFVAVYAVPVVHPDLPRGVHAALAAANLVIWLAFAVDLLVRVALAPRRWHYVATHPLDVAVVVLPALRPLRVLRVFTIGQTMAGRAGRFSLVRSTEGIAVAATLLVVMAAVAVLDAEQDVADPNITGFTDALWWAAVTVTTVGYGDHYPVSGTGRLVAVALMLVGISVFGAVTASLAAWFESLTRSAAERAAEAGAAQDAADRAEVQARLERMEHRLEAIAAALGALPGGAPAEVGGAGGGARADDRAGPAGPSADGGRGGLGPG